MLDVARGSVAPAPAWRVLMLTEGTYPHVMGGVSTWCDLLITSITDVRWLVYALTAGKLDNPAFTLPTHAEMAGHVQMWGTGQAPGGARHSRRNAARRPDLAATLVSGLLGWTGDTFAVAEALAWCREHPDKVIPSFKDTDTWDAYLDALAGVLTETGPDLGRTPDIDLNRAIHLYHTMSWIARVGAALTPEADVSLVTAAGWAGIPAIVDKALRGTPLMLAEHGIYVREAYLAAVRSSDGPATRFVSTRLARGLTRLTYTFADLVAPVAEAHRAWEEALGVPPERIRTIPNGVPAPAEAVPAPRNRTVVTVGRIDPLKDVQTLLRVAAVVRRQVPDAIFLHYGPIPRGQEQYAAECRRLQDELGLGEADGNAFRFMGPTSDPTGVVRDADVVLMSSISEGFPMSVLEALSQARPVVTTLVGGVLDGMHGAGIAAAPGDVHGLSDAVATLLLDPDLAERLGRRGHARVIRHFSQQRCVDDYRETLRELACGGSLGTGTAPGPAMQSGELRVAARETPWPMPWRKPTPAKAPRLEGSSPPEDGRGAVAAAVPPPTSPTSSADEGLPDWDENYTQHLVVASGRPPAPDGGGAVRDSRIRTVALLVAALTLFIGVTIVAFVPLDGDAEDASSLVSAGSDGTVSSESATSTSAAVGEAGLVITVTVLSGDLLEISEMLSWADGGPPELTLELSDLAAVSGVGGEFDPSVSDLEITLDGMPVDAVPDTGTAGEWLVESRGDVAPTTVEISYVLAGALIRTTPSQPDRGLAIIAPLSHRAIGSLPVQVELLGDAVLTIWCPDASAAIDQLCGRQGDDRWTAQPPPGQPPVVVVQVDLPLA